MARKSHSSRRHSEGADSRRASRASSRASSRRSFRSDSSTEEFNNSDNGSSGSGSCLTCTLAVLLVLALVTLGAIVGYTKYENEIQNLCASLSTDAQEEQNEQTEQNEQNEQNNENEQIDDAVDQSGSEEVIKEEEVPSKVQEDSKDFQAFQQRHAENEKQRLQKQSLDNFRQEKLDKLLNDQQNVEAEKSELQEQITDLEDKKAEASKPVKAVEARKEAKEARKAAKLARKEAEKEGTYEKTVEDIEEDIAGRQKCCKGFFFVVCLLAIVLAPVAWVLYNNFVANDGFVPAEIYNGVQEEWAAPYVGGETYTGLSSLLNPGLLVLPLVVLIVCVCVCSHVCMPYCCASNNDLKLAQAKVDVEKLDEQLAPLNDKMAMLDKEQNRIQEEIAEVVSSQQEKARE